MCVKIIHSVFPLSTTALQLFYVSLKNKAENKLPFPAAARSSLRVDGLGPCGPVRAALLDFLGLSSLVQGTSATQAASPLGGTPPAPHRSSLTTAPPVTVWTATAMSPWPTWVFLDRRGFWTAHPRAPRTEVSALALHLALQASVSGFYCSAFGGWEVEKLRS